MNSSPGSNGGGHALANGPENAPTDRWQSPKRIDPIFVLHQVPPKSELSAAKKLEKLECEAIIENGWQTVLAVGLALFQIRENGLYKDEYDNFDDYCREKWAFTKAHANRMIGAGKVAQILAPIGANRCQYKESQLRPLVPLFLREEGDEKVADTINKVWQMAKELAKDGPVTAKHVRKAVVKFFPLDHDKSKPPQAEQPKAKNDGLELFALLDEADAAVKDADFTKVSAILAKLRKGLAEH